MKCDIRFSVDEELEGVFPDPVPAVKMFPDYVKKLNPFVDDNDPQSSTVKRCLPFIDAMSMGYIIPLWADLQIIANSDGVEARFPNSMPIDNSISGHPVQQFANHPYSNSPLSEHAFKAINPWMIETPENWSCLFVPAINHFERKFQIVVGSVDTDNYYNTINFPFIWTGGEGNFLIKRGTPFVQVIPYYRGETTLHIGITDAQKKKKTRAKISTYAKDAYRIDHWHKRKKGE